MRRLELLIPGLRAAAQQAPPIPALGRLLARAEYHPALGHDSAFLLARYFGLESETYPSVAALSGLADDLKVAEGWWLRADPVHLQADLHEVLLSDQPLEALTLEAAQTLVASLNAHFQELGWCFNAPHPERWYLQLGEAPGIVTRPLVEARGQEIRPLLPEGADARLWRARLTEIQMLLFEHPLNREREVRGLAPVNSVWFWGEGRLPDKISAPAAVLHGGGALLRGLARLAGCELHPVPASAAAYLAMDHPVGLVLLDHLEYSPDRGRQLETLERDWFVPLLAGLRRGCLRELRLYPGDGYCYCLTFTRAWRFWRRVLPGERQRP